VLIQNEVSSSGNTTYARVAEEGAFVAKRQSLLAPCTFAADWMGATCTWGISTDGGKTWTPWCEAKFTKTTPAVKK
jgi:hypothetical protein